MRFELIKPCLQLQPYVKHLVISEADNEQTYRIMPDTSLVIGFQYRGKLSYSKDGEIHALASAGITGLMDGYRLFSNAAKTGSVLVVFNETGAAYFLRAPANEVFRQSVSLNNFFDVQQLRDVEDELCNAAGDTQRIELVQRFLISHLSQRQPDLLVHKALQAIYHSKGNIRISELAAELNTSESPLEKRFRALVGASPKKFARIVRTRNILKNLEQGDVNLADYLTAYYDQSHFIKEFKAFTSQTPEQYLKALRNLTK